MTTNRIDHRTQAEKCLERIPGAGESAREISHGTEAIAHALLAVEARLAELVTSQRVTNVIIADVESLIPAGSQSAAEAFVRAHIADIVDPGPAATPTGVAVEGDR